jgi:hypothetical protein
MSEHLLTVELKINQIGIPQAILYNVNQLLKKLGYKGSQISHILNTGACLFIYFINLEHEEKFIQLFSLEWLS